MENIKELKEEISASIQELIELDLDQLKVYLDVGEPFDPDNLCAALERAQENLELIKEKAEELAEILSVQVEMERTKEDD
jgi:hypothetical protein